MQILQIYYSTYLVWTKRTAQFQHVLARTLLGFYVWIRRRECVPTRVQSLL